MTFLNLAVWRIQVPYRFFECNGPLAEPAGDCCAQSAL